MLRNNLKLVLRRLGKERLFTLVNVTGLTIGLAAFLMISLYVKHELSFDKFHKDYRNIYRVTSKYQEREKRGGIASDYVDYFKDDLVNLKAYSRISPSFSVALVEGGGKELNVSGLVSVDANFFEFFSFKLLSGSPSSVFAATGSAVITESLSQKLFGDTDPYGQKLFVEKGEKVYNITGVVEDAPLNSSFSFEVVTFDVGHFKNTYEETYSIRNAVTYLKLLPSADFGQVVERLDTARFSPPYSMMTKDVKYSLSPIANQRLYADYLDTFFEQNDIRYLNLFGGIAIVVLLLAIINYVNLVTAQATKKTKEIGLRKVIGAGKYQLMTYQFVESILVVVISFILAFALTERMLPKFNALLNKDITLQYFGTTFFLWVAVAGVIIGVLSGLYPAIQIIRVSPLTLIRSSGKGSKQNTIFRKTLVLFQFTITALLLCSLIIMMSQMDYLKQKDLGFNASAILTIPLDKDSTQSYAPLKQEFLKIAGVQKASLGGFKPGGNAWATALDGPNERGKGANALGGDAIHGDAGLIDAMELNVYWQKHEKAIEEFSEGQVIVNKTQAKSLGALDDPEGKRVYGWSDQVGMEVVAIIEDFHMKSLKDEIEGITIYPLGSWGTSNILVKVEMNNLSTILSRLAKPYEATFGRPFEYRFLDDEIASFYKKEQGQFRLFQIFSTIALSISLLGLVALTLYSLEQRRKEVSIRKVLGASVQRLILLLNREYSILVILAFLIASPIAYYAMQGWLEEFKYRITVSPILFIGAFFGFLALSWLVTLGQSLKVSNENPADVLREE